MSVALLADAHIGGPGGPAEPLVGQLAALGEQGCSRLVLLGDLFQVWVGARRYETPEIRAVLGALEALAAAGVRLDYIEGNRDFFLERSPYAPLFASIGTELALSTGGRRVLAVHGDGLNERDRQYLFWRWLSKSPPSRVLMRRLPRALARWAVLRTERELAKTNFKHKARVPEEAILAYARRRLVEGYDEVVLGHFHEERRWRLSEGSVWLVDAWFRSRRIEWFPE
jgi:UDP-2,3-diacylglucosamine hydrolase